MTLRHCKVVFGVTPSPFLLSATFLYHLGQAPKDMKVTAEKLKRSFYVDNCITSEETEDELRKFVEEAKKLLISAKFELRRWISAPFHLETKETGQ